MCQNPRLCLQYCYHNNRLELDIKPKPTGGLCYVCMGGWCDVNEW